MTEGRVKGVCMTGWRRRFGMGKMIALVHDWVAASLRHGKDDSFGERELWEAAAVVSRRRRVSVENGEDGHGVRKAASAVGWARRPSPAEGSGSNSAGTSGGFEAPGHVFQPDKG
ncbi:hypothetical protein NL676_027712 [Syzygium grande]|nr:hypothetical protein NL676_027712 [Syzygium grande]